MFFTAIHFIIIIEKKVTCDNILVWLSVQTFTLEKVVFGNKGTSINDGIWLYMHIIHYNVFYIPR